MNSTEVDQVKAILDAIAQTEASETGLRATTLLRVVAANSDPPGFERSTAEYERLFAERQGEGKRRLFPILLTRTSTWLMSRANESRISSTA